MKIASISTSAAPAAIGPYSQAVSAAGLLFTSGQIPLDPATGHLVEGEFRARTERVLANLRSVLKAGGCSFADVVKTTVFMTDLARYAEFNDLYAHAMGEHRPARSVVQVSALPRGTDLEVEMVALLPGGKKTWPETASPSSISGS